MDKTLGELKKSNLVIIDHAEHDDLLSWRKEMRFSFSIPNEISGMKMHYSFDGDQPSYARAREFSEAFEELGITGFFSLADYPRDGDTLRYFFTTLEDAREALNYIHQEIDNISQWREIVDCGQY